MLFLVVAECVVLMAWRPVVLDALLSWPGLPPQF